MKQAIITRYVRQLFVAAGLPARDAQTVAEVFVLQEMRGIKTHGLRRVEHNLRSIRTGEFNAHPKRRVVSDRGATVVLDGDNGIGMLGCRESMNHAIRKARRYGIGIAITINNNHFLAAAPYCLQASEAGLIGIAFSNTYASMGYPGLKGRVIGNGPIGYAVPGCPLVFDAALSTSYGKLTQWAREGKSIPPGFLALDKDGNVTTDPKAVVDGGTPLPIGGHKGAGLVLLIEVLTGILGGGAFLFGLKAPSKTRPKTAGEGQCCIAIDVKHFMSPAKFSKRMNAFIKDLKRVPGQRAAAELKKSRRRGLTLDADLLEELRRLGREYGVAEKI